MFWRLAVTSFMVALVLNAIDDSITKKTSWMSEAGVKPKEYEARPVVLFGLVVSGFLTIIFILSAVWGQ